MNDKEKPEIDALKEEIELCHKKLEGLDELIDALKAELHGMEELYRKKVDDCAEMEVSMHRQIEKLKAENKKLWPFTTEEIEAGIDLEKLVRENAALKTENERLRYLRDNFVRCEPKMDGKHHWIAKGRLIGSGNTFEEAIDTAMKEEKP